MKNTKMTNLIRQKHRFLYHGQTFDCFDLSLGDFLLINIDQDSGYKKILQECNEELPTLNERQQKEFLRIIFWGEIEKQEVIEQLTETQKKIQDAKKSKKTDKQKNEVDDMLHDWHIIEWQMMHFLHQPLSEMRKRPYRYFMETYKDMAICTGAKEYNKNRNSQIPDKKWFKSEFGDMYNKK